MDRLLVSHTQYPVGQGGLHLCQLFSPGHSPRPQINILYDCGSSRGKRTLGPALRCVAHRLDPWSEGRRNLNVLILSHLHHDHVNGWDILFKKEKVTADRLIIPHYDDDLKLLLRAKLAAAGATASQLGLMHQVLQDPAGWFLERGVRQVIAVRPSETGTEPPPPLPEAGPPDGYEVLPRPEGPPPAERGELALSHELYVRKGSAKAKDEHRVVSVTNGTLACLTAAPSRNLAWVVVPYCQKTVPGGNGHQNICTFVAEIRNALQPYLQNKSLAPGNNASALLTALKDIWKKYVGKQHATWNILSVSAYLGWTDKKHLSNCEDAYPWLFCFPHCRTWGNLAEYEQAFCLWSCAVTGWILTGDSNLANPQSLSAWRQYFSMYLTIPMVFQGPHHGAARTFSPNALPCSPAAVFVTCASKDRKHPAASFRAQIGNSPLLRVTEDPHSLLTTAVVVRLPAGTAHAPP